MSRNKKSRRKSYFSFNSFNDEDPLSGVVNLFDIALVFVFALLIVLFTNSVNHNVIFSKDEITILKNPGQENMEIIHKKGKKIEKYRMGDNANGGNGKRLGICYQLPDGEVIYVPENMDESQAPPAEPEA